MQWIKDFRALYVLSFVGITITSFLRVILCHSIKVDDVSIFGWEGYIVSLLFLSFVGLHFYSFYKIIQHALPFSFRAVIIIHIVGLFMLPIISNDIYSVLAYGQNFNGTASIYVKPTSLNNPYYHYVSSLYTSIPCVYGILTVIIASWSHVSESVIMSVFLFKFIGILFSIIGSYSIYKTENIGNRTRWILILNPLWTIHAIGHTHTEIFCISLFYICIFLAYRKRLFFASIPFAFAFLFKFSILFLLPMLVYIYHIREHETPWMKLIKTAGIFILPIVLASLFELFYWGNVYSIIIPLGIISHLWPSGTFADIVFAIRNWWVESNILNYSGRGDESRILFLESLYRIFKCLFLFFVLYIFYQYRKNFWRQIPTILFAFTLGLLLLYSHRFMSWYLLLLFPYFIFQTNDKRFFIPLFFLGLFSTIQDCAHFNHFTIFHLGLLAISIPLTIFGQIFLLFSVLKPGNQCASYI